uniref:Uncharacterized protein n=2 Tax=Oryza glaberrima TaxID=4538 RepID=I1PPX7_ORYGL
VSALCRPAPAIHAFTAVCALPPPALHACRPSPPHHNNVRRHCEPLTPLAAIALPCRAPPTVPGCCTQVVPAQPQRRRFPRCLTPPAPSFSAGVVPEPAYSRGKLYRLPHDPLHPRLLPRPSLAHECVGKGGAAPAQDGFQLCRPRPGRDPPSLVGLACSTTTRDGSTLAAGLPLTGKGAIRVAGGEFL